MGKQIPRTAPEIRLLKLARSSNTRDIEKFPLMLFGLMRKDRINIKWLIQITRANQERTRFRELLALSRLLFEANELELPCFYDLPEPHQNLRNRFSRGRTVLMGHGRPIMAVRLKKYFGKHIGASWVRVQERSRRDYLLSLLLSPKQREIIRKRKSGLKLSKTEIEYFSRTIRDRLKAILDPEIRKIAVDGLN